MAKNHSAAATEITDSAPIHDTSGAEMPDTSRISVLTRRIRADVPILRELPVVPILVGLVSVTAVVGTVLYFMNHDKSDMQHSA